MKGPKLTREDFYSLYSLRKLDEANYFLGQIKQNLKKHPLKVEFNFNAFISAIWSTTKHLQKELCQFDKVNLHYEKAIDWYNKAIEKIKSNNTCRLFYELRTQNVHNIVIDLIPLWEVEKKRNKVKFTKQGYSLSLIDQNLKKFKELSSPGDLLELAETHYKEIEKLMREANQRFGFRDAPPAPFNTSGGYINQNGIEKGVRFYMENFRG